MDIELDSVEAEDVVDVPKQVSAARWVESQELVNESLTARKVLFPYESIPNPEYDPVQ